jgi:RHS repeat-associated protein
MPCHRTRPSRINSHLPSLGAAGNLAWQTYGSGHVHGLSLDGQELIHFERDNLHRETERRFGVLHGKLASPLSLTRQFDAVGRLLNQQISGVPQAATPQIDTLAYLGAAYGYDGAGQLASLLKVATLSTQTITPNDKTVTQYRYDSAQRLVAWERDGMGKTDTSQLANWRFDPAGNRLPMPSAGKSSNSDSGDTAAADWHARVQQNLNNPHFNLLEPDQNPTLRPEERIERWQNNRVDFNGDQVYTHDAYGNLVKLENLQTHETTQYGYDGEHRLVWLQNKTTTNTAATTATKPVSKSIAKKQLNTSASAETSNKNSISTTTVRYTYDALGRRLQKQVIRDAEARPETTPETTHFGWDGDRLVSTETASSKTHTVYEPGSFVPLLRISQAVAAGSPKTEAEATEANARGLLGLMAGKTEQSSVTLPGFGQEQWAGLNSAVAHLAQHGYNADIREALRQGGLDPEALEKKAKDALAQQQAEQTAKLTIQMYHCNHLGTPIALINTQGLIDWAVELDPWGNVLNEFNPNEIDQPIRMQGQQIDRESGLFYNRHRYYDPQMGRYITQDPIGLEGGVNLYGYVEGNPAGTIDPLGLDSTVWRIPNGPTNGNWGGRCWSGGQKSCGDAGMGNLPPLDSADAIYKKHDICLSKTNNKTSFVSPEETACHRAMTDELEALPDNPKQWPQPPKAGTEADSRSFKKHAQGYFFPAKK